MSLLLLFGFSSVQSLDGLGRLGDMRNDSAEIIFQSFLQGGPCKQFLHGQGYLCFDVVHPAFPLLTTVSPTLQVALNDGFGEAIMACNMPEPFKFPSLDSCQKRLLWTHKGLDSFAPLLQVGDAEKFPPALGFEVLDLFFQSQQAGSMFQ